MSKRVIHNRKRTEDLIDALKHYLPGNEEERRERLVSLLNQIVDEKALKYLRTKFQLQGYKHLQTLIEDTEEIGKVWEEEAVKGVIEMASKKKAKSKATKEANKRVNEEEAKDKKLRKEPTKDLDL